MVPLTQAHGRGAVCIIAPQRFTSALCSDHRTRWPERKAVVRSARSAVAQGRCRFAV